MFANQPSLWYYSGSFWTILCQILGAMCPHGPALGDVRMAGHEVRPRSFMESNCNCSFSSDLQIAVGQTPSQSTFNLARACRPGKQWKHGKDHSVSGVHVCWWDFRLSVKLCCVLLALRRRLVVSVALEWVSQVLESTLNASCQIVAKTSKEHLPNIISEAQGFASDRLTDY